MSQPFPARQVIRCPLCTDPGNPQHVGQGVLYCECCGNRFRVVHANPGRTGRRLDQFLEKQMEFPSGPQTNR